MLEELLLIYCNQCQKQFIRKKGQTMSFYDRLCPQCNKSIEYLENHPYNQMIQDDQEYFDIIAAQRQEQDDREQFQKEKRKKSTHKFITFTFLAVSVHIATRLLFEKFIPHLIS